MHLSGADPNQGDDKYRSPFHYLLQVCTSNLLLLFNDKKVLLFISGVEVVASMTQYK